MRRLGLRRGGQPAATVVLGAASVLVFFLTHDLSRILPLSRWSLSDSAFGNYATFAPFVAELGEWWRIVTGAFLHADVRHLLFNMVVLYLLGRRLETFVGPAVLTGTYAVSLAGGAAGAMLHRPEAAMVGASGAVYGLMGAAFVVEYLRGGNPWRDGLGSLIIVNVIISFLIPGISIGGHLGGLVAGVAAGFAIGDTSRRREAPTLADRLSDRPIDTRVRRSPVLVWALLAAVGTAAFAGALAAAAAWRSPLL